MNQKILSQSLPKEVKVSFEFFPPTTEKSMLSLWKCIKRLQPVRPSFVSVTYGAGGTTRERTHETVVRIAKETNMKSVAHLTCIGSNKHEITSIADRYWQVGVRHIVALRGDSSDGKNSYIPHPGGYAFASDLVEGLRKVADFEISVAAYPECHPESKNQNEDLDNLQRKIDAGATRAITQYFFDPDVYLRFLEQVRGRGIQIPIIPGILPVTNFNQVKKFSALSGTHIPDWLADLFEDIDDDQETRKLVAASVASEQCRVLCANGIQDFHFFTLNRSDLTYAICHILGVRPNPREE